MFRSAARIELVAAPLIKAPKAYPTTPQEVTTRLPVVHFGPLFMGNASTYSPCRSCEAGGTIDPITREILI